ncbi:hypothetical protein HOE67_03625 [Candidatus Peregrinibacteria bacterium]|jgi:hypothetical protein|nr:hypothetical protein [Candidatus Peregrinibacteria bacterium]MBT4056175.1 hypothetical protein [Candidatus Peregrinibacteria bacterium]
MNEVSKTDFRQILEEAFKENGGSVPKNFQSDFEEIFGDLPSIKAYNQIRTELCERLKKGFERDEYRLRYEKVVPEIRKEVRLALALGLGFEEEVQSPGKGGIKAIRDLLLEFLGSLEEGEAWETQKLQGWTKRSTLTGKRLYSRVVNKAPWLEKTVQVILGENHEAILKRNPFQAGVVRKITSKSAAKKYLRQFLSSLKKGQSWSATDLVRWEGDVKGNTLWTWLSQRGGSEILDKQTIEWVLGDFKEEDLGRNPFEKRQGITSEAEARETLVKFLKSLAKGQVWSHKDLYKWRNKEGTSGGGLISWIERNLPGSEEGVRATSLKKLLGKKSSLLNRNPFTRRPIAIKTIKDARAHTRAFLESVKPGTTWSTSTLHAWEGGVRGATLCQWLKKNLRKNGKFDWPYVLERLGVQDELKVAPFASKKA